MSYSDTKILYITVYIITTLFAFLSQRRRKGKLVFRDLPFFCAFAIHWIVLAFTNIGVDYDHYVKSIEWTGFSDLSLFEEFVFNGLGYLLYSATKSADVTIFIIKSIEIVILYYGFYRIRYQCNLGLAVLSYNALIFLQSILLLSMHFAIVLLFLSFIYLLEKKWRKAIFIALLSCTIHASAILLLPVYVVYFLYTLKDKQISMITLLIAAVVILFVFSNLDSLFEYALSKIGFFQHYAIYGLISNYEGSGIMQILYFIPVFYFVVMIMTSTFENNVKNAAIVFSVMAFVCAMLGYKMEVFARMNMNFLGLYSALVPMTLYAQRFKTEKFKIKIPYSINLVFWVSILLLRAYLVFQSNLSPDNEGEIQVYRLFNPFS